LGGRLLQQPDEGAADNSTRSVPARRREAGRVANAEAYQCGVLET
nr:hypothetical protein [Tanacetum cinerariifolium]